MLAWELSNVQCLKAVLQTEYELHDTAGHLEKGGIHYSTNVGF